MGNEIETNDNNIENENNQLKISKEKAPDFFLNINYPNYGNKTLKEIIKEYLDGNSDSFHNNNTTNNIDENLLTPTFNRKHNKK